MNRPVIDILLATFNGARYLEAQLRSLIEQDFKDWRLITRDDGSTDGTQQILREFRASANVPVIIVQDGETGLGASRNFGRLLEHSDAPYFAFCDQDDVWLRNKLSTSLRAIKEAETELGTHAPILAHCDLAVVDSDLNLIAPSLRKFANLRTPPEQALVQHLMLQNIITGCAMMGNGALRRKALPIAPQAMMHDWWLAIVACIFGRIVEIDEPLIRYRQHGANTLGAQRSTFWSKLKRFAFRPQEAFGRARIVVDQTRHQAAAIAERYGQADDRAIELYRRYAETWGSDFLPRKTFVLRNRVYSNSIIRIIVMGMVI